MGQPVTVIEKPSSRAGVVRYELNRVLTGMGHEVYHAAPTPGATRPADELARRLFARGGIKTVHLNGSVVTITLSSNNTEGIVDIIQNLYTYYVPGVLPPTDEELLADTPS